jgi:hypothetical protein
MNQGKISVATKGDDPETICIKRFAAAMVYISAAASLAQRNSW